VRGDSYVIAGCEFLSYNSGLRMSRSANYRLQRFAIDIMGYGTRRIHAALRDRGLLPLSLPALIGLSLADLRSPRRRV
jgi:hypothetical protein